MANELAQFKGKNPQVKVVEDDENIILSNLWDDDTFICIHPKDTDLSELEGVCLPSSLSAIYHVEKKFIEFIWGPVDNDNPLLKRKFKFLFLQKEFEAEFTSPSKVLEIISTGFTIAAAPSVTDYRNLRQFRDYYKKPPFLQDYFKNKTGAVLKISGDLEDVDLVTMSKNLNFYIRFFDRSTPFILIFDNYQKEKYPVPCLSMKEAFPSIISVHKIDPILVDLFEVARKTNNTRLRFLFYYQVLEYCSYYHLNETLKKRLTIIIKRPDLMNNPLEYGRLITEEFKDHFKSNDDAAKLQKLLEDFITNSDISLEIGTNFEFFSKTHTFDGDFSLEALISNRDELTSTNKDLIRKTKQHLEKIRNVLVHIRESRENKVILPTERNTNLLTPYLYLIQRIAEHVAMNYE